MAAAGGRTLFAEGIISPLPRHRLPDGFTYQVRLGDITFRTCATRAEAEEAYEAAQNAWAVGGPFNPDSVDGEMYHMACDAVAYDESFPESVSYAVVKVDDEGGEHEIPEDDDEDWEPDDFADDEVAGGADGGGGGGMA